MTDLKPDRCSTEGVPLRVIEPRLQLVRSFLADAGFSKAAVCRGLGVERASEIGKAAWHTSLDAIAQPLRWCIETFLRGANRAVDRPVSCRPDRTARRRSRRRARLRGGLARRPAAAGISRKAFLEFGAAMVERGFLRIDARKD